jgi:outer membrane protein assembly factor BamE (lipoprotein component of BamABCDE complex)
MKAAPSLARRVMPLLLSAVVLGACGTRAPLATKQVTQAAIEQSVVPGRTTKAQVLAALGPTTTQVFDSGYEVWLYSYSAAGSPWPPLGRGKSGDAEFVILFGPDGVVKKTRHRDPPPGKD